MPANITLKMSPSNFLAMLSSSLLDYLVLESRALHSTQSLLRVSDVTLNRFRHMRASSWARWINPMLILSKVFHRQSPSIRNQQIETRALRSEQSLRSTTTLDCSSLAQVDHTAQAVRSQFHDRVRNKLLIKFSQCLRQPNSRS